MPGIEEEHKKDEGDKDAEPPAEVPRTQTDRINSHLLKSFLTHINNDPQYQNVAPEPPPPISANSSQEQSFD